jgi:hypothetical protein
MGQEHEIRSAEILLGNDPSDYLLADRRYDCDTFKKTLHERGIEAVIRGKKN